VRLGMANTANGQNQVAGAHPNPLARTGILGYRACSTLR